MPFAAAAGAISATTVASTVAVIGVAASVSGSVNARRADKRRRTVQGKINRQNKRVSDIKAARDRRRIARESRIQRAKINSATQGNASSRASGVTGSVITQTASSLGFAGQQQQAANNIFNLGGELSGASADLASAQNLIQVGSSASSLSRDIKSSKSIFD